MAIERPESYADAAAVLREAASAGRLVRPRGGATKWTWGGPVPDPDVVLSTGRLDRVLEHNEGDLTAVLQAGVRLADAQAEFAAAGQMLALDPPLGDDGAATVGGVVATADAGPIRHRYGAARDLVLGVAVALPDGTVARSGGKVIKNVAGYDLAKLFAGSFGTQGTIVEVVVRLHPRPAATATVAGETHDPRALERAALDLAAAPLELEALDVGWDGGRGTLLAQVGGVASGSRAAAIAERLAAIPSLRASVVEGRGPSNSLLLEGFGPAGGSAGTAENAENPAVVEGPRVSNSLLLEGSEAALWQGQRERQRSEDGIVVRVSSLPTELARTIAAVERRGGSLAGRAALGLWWITLPARAPESVARLRLELAPWPCVVTDAPADVRSALDVWGTTDEAVLRLSRRVKERFDPAGVCGAGVLR